VADWLAERISSPGQVVVSFTRISSSAKWPHAAFGSKAEKFCFDASQWPRIAPYNHLLDVVDSSRAKTLSRRAAAGFLSRAKRSRLNFMEGFLEDVQQHVDYLADSESNDNDEASRSLSESMATAV
jgi:DNA (cytosine-5)-methyltransferase 1